MKRVKEGYRPEKPEHCDREIYNMMFYCWDKDPAERPSFSQLVIIMMFIVTMMVLGTYSDGIDPDGDLDLDGDPGERLGGVVDQRHRLH